MDFIDSLFQQIASNPLPVVIAFILFLLIVYFLPTFIAVSRKHRQSVPIFVLNLLLGCTFIGWVAALVWALTTERKQ